MDDRFLKEKLPILYYPRVFSVALLGIYNDKILVGIGFANT